MTEKYKPVRIYCDVGKTRAEVMIPAEENLDDNTLSHIVSNCAGCQDWTEDRIAELGAI